MEKYTDNPKAAYPELKSIKIIPTLKGFVKGNQISVWCPFCNNFHTHGWTVNGSKLGKQHRVAHCWDKIIDHQTIHPLLSETGYYIKPFSKGELKRFGINIQDK